jgi:hypothetical protein
MEPAQSKKTEGIKRLVQKGREAFHITENLNHYSEEDYKIAEKKYIKLCVMQRRC